MCGIAGIVDFSGAPVARHDVETMTRALAHRGPDGQDVWVDGHVGLGHRRLAIRDLGDGGRQPMFTADRSVVSVYNGEIYNDAAIRQQLTGTHGTQFHTSCDAEVLAPGWSAWGHALWDHVEGMYAVALWDRAQQALVLARDPAGIKPLYVRRVDERWYFSSEIKALLAVSGVRPRLSPIDLHRFLAQGYAGPSRSLIEGVTQVAPGTALVVTRGGGTTVRHWLTSRQPDIFSADEAREAFDRLWPRVVSDLLVSDVPVGVLLSGGVDSALVAAELGGSGRAAFTGRFPLPTWDESALAARTAAALELPHHVADVRIDVDVEATFRRVVAHVDGHLADSSCVPFYLVCEQARRVVPVLLSGDGADEFFAGYPTYRATMLAEGLRPWLPRRVSGAIAARLPRFSANSHVPISGAEQLQRLLTGLASSNPGASHPQWRRYLMRAQAAALYGPALRPLLDVDPLDEYAAAMPGEGALVDRCLVADQVHYLPADMLAKADLMSMAHGLEIRVPFLDRRVMKLASRLDHRLLLSWRGGKRVLRDALDRRPGRPGSARTRKRGFNMPVALTLRQGLRPLGTRLLAQAPDCLSPWCDPDGVRALWHAHQEGRADHGYVLWTLLTLAEWLTSVSVTHDR